MSGYQLPVTDYQLPITGYQLPVTDYQLPITGYRLPITNYQLPITLNHSINQPSRAAQTTYPVKVFSSNNCANSQKPSDSLAEVT
ncbi:hypothetical protein [Moorena sp. SIO4G3]|uniref:hypothetical protein n=1 Tax=Moorena sp. SIO4G3 TaxID=2607821 RepID=UPI00344283C0